MAVETSYKHRQEVRNLLRFFVKFCPIDLPQEQGCDALIADSSENGVGLFTDSTLPVGTSIKLTIEGREPILGKIVNRDYLFPDSAEIIRLGVHFDKTPENWPIK